MKLAVLGGGGVRSPFLAKSLAVGAADAGIDEVVFMDIDRNKLSKYGKIAQKIAHLIAPDLDFTLTTDARAALTGADYVITTIRAEGDDGRVFDERTALDLGLLGQETTGAGGFAMALRSIHVLADYCALMRRVSSPNVLVFNFTNPSGLVTQALRTMGYSNVYGICDAPSGFVRQLRDMTGRPNLTAECFGLNHLSWFFDFKDGGRDITELVLNHPNLYKDTEMRLFSAELVRMCSNMLPNEYLYFYYYREKAVQSILRSSMTRGETIRDINLKMDAALDQIDIDNDFDAAFDCYMRHYAMREDSYFAIESGHRREHKWPVFHAADYIKQPEKDSYAAVALTFIRSLASGKPVEMVLSVPNEGALPCLAPEDVAELSCTVDADGVHPHRFASIPPMHAVLIQAVKLYENLTVRAILEKDRSLAVQALTVHPLIGSYSLAEQLVEAYSKRYSAYIGGWES